MSISPQQLSIVIPSYRRGEILLQTLHQLMELSVLPREILVVDQTETYSEEVLEKIKELEKRGVIRQIILPEPSIPHAMNIGLQEAKGDIVLFLDDDIIPSPNLVLGHAACHDGSVVAVCGQVLQPSQEPENLSVCELYSSRLRNGLDFPFNATESAELFNVMAGNLSVRRDAALSIGGFDEQFLGVAYRFETDFARRLTAEGHRIVFSPQASIRHLRLSTGGTRNQGDHLQRPSAMHSVGDYYFALRHSRGTECAAYILRRLFKETVNRYYLRHPWTAPKKFLSEFQGLELAYRLYREGPRFVLQKEEYR